MPGAPGDIRLQRIAEAMQAACVRAGVPGIESDAVVTVTYGGVQVISKDRTLGVIVTGLFERLDRTPEVLARLASVLAEEAAKHLRSGWKVEVLIFPFNPQGGRFVSKEVT